MRNWYSRWIESPLARPLAASLRNDPSWSPGWCYGAIATLDHPNGAEVWVGGGWWSCATYKPAEVKLGILGRTRVWFAARGHLRAANQTARAQVEARVLAALRCPPEDE